VSCENGDDCGLGACCKAAKCDFSQNAFPNAMCP
jgi:hypothetical protein